MPESQLALSSAQQLRHSGKASPPVAHQRSWRGRGKPSAIRWQRVARYGKRHKSLRTTRHCLSQAGVRLHPPFLDSLRFHDCSPSVIGFVHYCIRIFLNPPDTIDCSPSPILAVLWIAADLGQGRNAAPTMANIAEKMVSAVGIEPTTY